MAEEFLWVEKYRPHTVEDTILPEETKKVFAGYVKSGNVPNLLLVGGPGIGKTTVARSLVEQLGSDYIVINGSLDGNIDTLRNDIRSFASAASFTGGRKYVILDEADGLNPNSTQPALRAFIEEFSLNCGFILTCNFPNKVIEPLRSRLSVVDFKIAKEDRPEIAKQVMKRVTEILKAEGVEYEPQVVAELIKRFFPDWRKVIGELQKYSVTGKIDTGILSTFSDENMKKLFVHMKDKNFTEVRKWVAENSDVASNEIFRRIYDTGATYVVKGDLPKMVLVLGEYQFKAAFVADHEINVTAALTEIMARCAFV